MVGEDADRGDSRLEPRTSRRAGTAQRHDLQAGSLASWSRALDDQRRELLAGVGHELKTPLSIVLGLCGRLLATELGDGQTQDVERVRANAYVLLKRVEELLQVSRLDGGHLELELRDVDVARLVRASCEGFASVAELRRQRLVVEAPDELPAHVDEEKLLSVVSNLLANALKHAPQGGIVRCSGGGSRRPAAHRGRRQRARRGRRDARGDLRALPPGRRQRVAARRHRAGPGDRARPRLAARRHGHARRRARGRGAVRGRPAAANRRRRTSGRAAPPPTIDVVERQRPTVERLRAELVAAGRRGATPTPRSRGSERPSTLIVTADAELGAFVQEIIARRYAVRHATDPLQAARLIAEDRPDAVLLDAGGRRARDRRAAPAARRGPAADLRGVARGRSPAHRGGRARLRRQAVRRRRAAGAPRRARRPRARGHAPARRRSPG